MTYFPTKSIYILLVILALNAHRVFAGEEHGKQVFSEWCTPCHMDSPFAPGTIQLTQVRGAENSVLEKRTDLTAPLIRTFVRSGFAGMPKFRRTEISEADLDALIKYLVKP